MPEDAGPRRAILLGFAVWILAEGFIALTLRVEGYDGYWYLSNAWYLAGGGVSRYETTKAPLLSLLYLPLFWLRAAGLAERAVFALAHLVSLGLTLATGWLLARVLRERFSAGLATAGAFAFLGSRVVVRYGAFAMSDIPATFGTLLALHCVWRDRERDGVSARLPFALAGAAAVLARYPSGLIIPVAVGWDAVAIGLRKRSLGAAARRGAHHLWVQATVGAGVVLLHLLVYGFSFGGPGRAVAALGDMVSNNLRLGGISARFNEPWWEYGPLFVLSCTLPAALLILLGAIGASRRGGGLEALHGAWALAHLGFVSFVSSHKEARYLLPALPSLLLFMLWGLRTVAPVARALLPALRPPPLGQAAAVALLMVTGLYTMTRELLPLTQPFFREPRGARIAALAEERAGPQGRLFWAGNYFPLHPARFVFTPRDEYYYIFHLAPHVLEYYGARPVHDTRDRVGQLADGVAFPIGLGTALADGDVVISSVPEVTVTARMPAEGTPLLLSKVGVTDLRPEPSPGGSGRSFRGEAWSLTARLLDGSPPVVILNGPPSLAEIIVRRRPGAPVSLGLVRLEGGEGRLPLTGGLRPGDVESLRVALYFPEAVPGTGGVD